MDNTLCKEERYELLALSERMGKLEAQMAHLKDKHTAVRSEYLGAFGRACEVRGIKADTANIDMATGAISGDAIEARS